MPEKYRKLAREEMEFTAPNEGELDGVDDLEKTTQDREDERAELKETKNHQAEISEDVALPETVEKKTFVSRQLAAVKEKAWNYAPYVLEAGHKANKYFDKGLNFVQKGVNRVVPATAQLATGFLPGHITKIIDKTVEYGTKGATFIGKNLAKTGVNVFTFGAPAWVEAFRQHRAVAESSNKFSKAESGKDILSLAYIDHLKDGKTRKALKEYYQSRKKLARLRTNEPGNEEKIMELSTKIASFEVNYKDNVDFQSLKSTIEQGKDFIKSNESFVEELANKTADNMISTAEDFYKKKVSPLSDKVEIKGKWWDIFSSPERKREKLVAAISKRLKEVMFQELDDKKVQNKMKEVNKQISSNFGLFRNYLQAGSYALLRLIPIPKAPEGGFPSVWQRINEGARTGLKTGWSGKAPEVVPKLATEGVKGGGFNFLPSMKEYADYANNLGSKAVGKCTEAMTVKTGEGLRQAYDSVKDWLLNRSVQQILKAVPDVQMPRGILEGRVTPNVKYWGK